MKQLVIIFLWSITFLITACGQSKTNMSDSPSDKFEAFKKKEKFLEDRTILYPGIADQQMKSILTKKINFVADDFEKLAESNSTTDQDYQDKIKVGLQRFSDVYINLDTEDRERICHYFEELMDIVGLQSSGGHLNEFMYGFDPAKK